jgi:hypothetical protein
VIKIQDIDVCVVVCPKFLANCYTFFHLNLVLLKGDKLVGTHDSLLLPSIRDEGDDSLILCECTYKVTTTLILVLCLDFCCKFAFIGINKMFTFKTLL